MYKWDFPSYKGYENRGLNASEIDNKISPLQTFVREVCQNSNDARDNHSISISIEFNTFNIDTKDFPDVDGLRHVMACCTEKTGEMKYNTDSRRIYEEREDYLRRSCIEFLRVSDFNTTGLTGSREDGSSAWHNATVGTGISDKKEGAGGSHGRGKDSFYAISGINTVFYSTLDNEGYEASIGVSKQITFVDDGDRRDGFGCFVDENKKFSNTQLMLDPNFKRNEPGTDIFIPAYKRFKDAEFQIRLAVVRDFFVSILDGRMSVTINGITINKHNLEVVLNELKGRTSEEIAVIGYTKELVACYKKGPVIETEEYRLYLACSEEFFYVSTVRSGMTIDNHFHKLPQDHIIGLIIVDQPQTSKLLADAEGILHNSWRVEQAQKPNQYRIAQLLKAMKESIRKEANKIIEKENGPVKDAVGLNRYLPISCPENKDEVLRQKEFLYDPIRKVKIAKRKTLKPRSEEASVRTDDEELPTAQPDDEPREEPTFPIHGENPNPIPYKDPTDHVEVQPGDNQEYVRMFKTASLKEVRPICSDTETKSYKVYYRCDKTVPFYIRVFMGGESAEIPLDVLQATGEDRKEYAVDGNRIGPIEPNKGKRTYIMLRIDYPIPCNIQIGGEVGG